MKYFPNARYLSLSAVVIQVASGNLAHALVIEDFTTAPLQSELVWFTPGANSYTEAIPSVALGGERDFEFQPSVTGLESRWSRRIAPTSGGRAFRAQADGVPPGAFNVAGVMTLQYDGTGDEQGTGNGGLLNDVGTGSFSLPGNVGGIRMHVRYIGSNPLDVAVVLRNDGSVLSENVQQVFETSPDGYLYFPFAASDLATCDSLSIEMRFNVRSNQVQNLNIFTIDTIVPEPGTYLALGGGLVWLLRRRKGKGESVSG